MEYPKILYTKDQSYVEVADADQEAFRYSQGYRFNPAGKEIAPPAGYKEADKAKAKP